MQMPVECADMQMSKCADGNKTCGCADGNKCADVEMSRCAAVQMVVEYPDACGINSHICTFAHPHIN